MDRGCCCFVVIVVVVVLGLFVCCFCHSVDRGILLFGGCVGSFSLFF